jgi:hypothetical protein
LHLVGDLFELNAKLWSQKVKCGTECCKVKQFYQITDYVISSLYLSSSTHLLMGARGGAVG